MILQREEAFQAARNATIKLGLAELILERSTAEYLLQLGRQSSLFKMEHMSKILQSMFFKHINEL